MHLYLAIRGHKERVERWLNDCLAQYYPYKHKKDEEKGILQLAMRPIVLYECTFPEDQLMTVLATLRPRDIKGFERTGLSNKLAGVIRKLLKLDPMPTDEEIKKHKPIYPMNKTDIDITAIGTKKDTYKDGIEQI